MLVHSLHISNPYHAGCTGDNCCLFGARSKVLLSTTPVQTAMSRCSDSSPDYCNSSIGASASSQACTQHGVWVEVCVRAEVGSAHTACHCICCCHVCFVGNPGHVIRAMAGNHLCCCGFPDRQPLTLVCRQIRMCETCTEASLLWWPPKNMIRAVVGSHLRCCGFPDRQPLTLVYRQIRMHETCRKASRCTVIIPEHGDLTDICLMISCFAQAVWRHELCCLCLAE